MQNKLNGLKEFEYSSIGYTLKFYTLNNKILGPTEVTSKEIKSKSYYCRF
jgi:hypothetical protein